MATAAARKVAPAPAAIGPEERPSEQSGARRQRRPLSRKVATPLWHRVVEKMIIVMATTAILAIALIFIFIVREAAPMFWEAGFAEEVRLVDLFAPRQWPGYDEAVYVWQPVGELAKFNVLPLFMGTLKVTILAMLFSVPVGVACAIFLALYAPRRVRDVLKPLIELLAGVPSVVLGFFALMVIATWAQDTFGFAFRLNAIVAAIGLSMAIVPVIFTISEDAIQAVPGSLSDAALALGARKYQIALRIVLPAALPGISAGVILGFGRAIGETMIVLMASGNAAILEPANFASSVRTVTATIAAELGEVAVGDPHWRVLFLLGAMLFAVTFVLNIVGDIMVKRLEQKLTASVVR